MDRESCVIVMGVPFLQFLWKADNDLLLKVSINFETLICFV